LGKRPAAENSAYLFPDGSRIHCRFQMMHPDEGAGC
jgi:hypothetical protein